VAGPSPDGDRPRDAPDRRLAAVALLLVVPLAGCGLAPPTDGGTTVAVSVANEAETLRVVTVSVVPGGFDAVTVTYADGSERTVDASSLDGVPADALDGAVGVRAAGEGVQTARYDLPPGTGRGQTFDGPRGNVTVLYSVAAPDRAASETLRSAGVGTCGPNTANVTVDITVHPGDNVDLATTCAG
jgi:hypothetical protein